MVYAWKSNREASLCDLTARLGDRAPASTTRRECNTIQRSRRTQIASHGRSKRWLGVTLLPAPLTERSERLHTFRGQTSLSPEPVQGTGLGHASWRMAWYASRLSHFAYIVTFVPSRPRCSLAEMNPGAWRTETSVARARRCISSSCLVGSTVKTLISVIGGETFIGSPAFLAALSSCYAKAPGVTPNDEPERPPAAVQSAPRVHNISALAAQPHQVSRPLQALVRKHQNFRVTE